MKRLIGIVAILVMAINVNAIGIGLTYLENNTLKINNCEIKELEFELQNGEDTDREVIFDTESNGCIITNIVDSQDKYILEANHGSDPKIKVEFIAPEDCSGISNINYGMARAGSQFGLKFSQSLNVEVVNNSCNDITREAIASKLSDLEETNETEISSLAVSSTEKPINVDVRKPFPVWGWFLMGGILVLIFLANRTIIYMKNHKKKEESSWESRTY